MPPPRRPIRSDRSPPGVILSGSSGLPAARLLPLYDKETEVKRAVASWLAHAGSASALTAMKAAWVHDAYLTQDVLALQECLGGEVTLDDGGRVVGTPVRASPAALASPALRQMRS